MAELADFVRHGASKVTPRDLQSIYKKLPVLKVSIAEIQAPQFPHLHEQLLFLANLIEDFVEKKAEDIPYVTLANAAFAILYTQRELDIIPDSVPNVGLADDSGVVRVVLIDHERVLAAYAEKTGSNWRKITVKP